MAVVLIGTLDTKGDEFHFVREALRCAGITTLVIDAGVLGAPKFTPDISREQVYKAAGTSWEQIQRGGDRGRAIEAASRGVVKIVLELVLQEQVDGILSLGGS